MKPDQIEVGKVYVGGDGKLRKVLGYGANERYLECGWLRHRLPLGGYLRTHYVSRRAFARWADREHDDQLTTRWSAS